MQRASRCPSGLGAVRDACARLDAGRARRRRSPRARRRRRCGRVGSSLALEPHQAATPSPSSTSGPRRSAGSAPASPARPSPGIGFDRDRLHRGRHRAGRRRWPRSPTATTRTSSSPGWPGRPTASSGSWPASTTPAGRRSTSASASPRSPPWRGPPSGSCAASCPSEPAVEWVDPSAKVCWSSGRSPRPGPGQPVASSSGRARSGSCAVGRLGVAADAPARPRAQDGDVRLPRRGRRRARRRRRPASAGAGHEGRPLMRVVIAGGGNVGRFIAEQLHEAGHEVLIVENDPAVVRRRQRARRAGRRDLVGGRRLRGHPARPRPSVDEADVVAAVTGDDEDNLVISLLAKQEFGVPRVVARVNNPKNEWMFNEMWGVDVAVSTPHLLTALVEEAVSVGVVRAAAVVRGRQGPPGRGHAGRRARRRTARRSSSSACRATPPWWPSSARTGWWCPGATPCSAPATRCSCSSPPTSRRTRCAHPHRA